ncbi:uncharacterized protein LOC135223253 [Macrobrachium nipponense]|uniref:uncharacterized protein LOC135223253 n=1 Tax=Macrobrachium nipponense TaxID=159736 RepID=UPI0030C8BB1C
MRAASMILVMTLLSMGMLCNLVRSSVDGVYDVMRTAIFTGKVMPAQYIKHNVTVEKPCQCRHLCYVVINCTSTTWLRMAESNASRCLISETYFGHLELQEPGQGISSATTFYWFKSDFTRGKYGFYKVHCTELQNFSVALNTCKAEGGQLATLETTPKRDEVTALLIQGDGARYWIGLYREGPTANPVWMNVNGNMSVTSGTITAKGSENCYSLVKWGSWIVEDHICNSGLCLVCERNFY